jgi:hypothetical protein
MKNRDKLEGEKVNNIGHFYKSIDFSLKHDYCNNNNSNDKQQWWLLLAAAAAAVEKQQGRQIMHGRWLSRERKKKSRNSNTIKKRWK